MAVSNFEENVEQNASAWEGDNEQMATSTPEENMESDNGLRHTTESDNSRSQRLQRMLRTFAAEDSEDEKILQEYFDHDRGSDSEGHSESCSDRESENQT